MRSASKVGIPSTAGPDSSGKSDSTPAAWNRPPHAERYVDSPDTEGHGQRRLSQGTCAASLVLYLCSEAAAGITGAAYSIDGGWTAR